MPRQRRIGLTGGIASGKSSVGRWLAQQHVPVLDADQYAHDVLAPGEPAWQAVIDRYGSAVLHPGSDPTQPAFKIVRHSAASFLRMLRNGAGWNS